MITTPDGLRGLAKRLHGTPILACDLEADSLHRYQEKVCLLQFSSPEFSALVDPLAVTDLSPLAPLMADPTILKVFHGADYDIRSLHREFGIEIHNLFDTMIASQFLGAKEVGLAAALKKRFGVELDKRFQKADWSRRPLPPEMLTYAAEDTSLLIDLYRQLAAELQAKGRLAWVEEECLFLTQVRVTVREKGPRFLRFKGAARFEPRVLAVLEELLAFRDEQARRLDRPPFKVLGNEPLAELAVKRPRGTAELAGIKGLSDNIIQRQGSGLLRAIAQGCAIPAAELPRFPLPSRPDRDPRKEARLKRLKEWREGKSRELEIDPGLLANNVLLEAMAGLATGAPVAPVIPRDWQRRLFADEVAELLG